MLVLTRKVNESIRIGDDIIINILQMQCGKVRVGITAPSEIKIHREELYKRIADGVKHKGFTINDDNRGNC
jgi:carbon storage regulator